MRLFANRNPNTPDEPVPDAELAAWDGVIRTMEELDRQAGTASEDTAAARSAFRAAAARNRRRS